MHTLPSHPPVWHRRNHSKFVFYAAKWKVFLPSLSTRWCLLRKVRVRQSSWTRYSRQWGAKLFANSINNNKNESFWSRFPPLGCCWLVIAQWIIYYSIKLWKIVERMLFQCLMRSRPPIHFFFSSGQANGCEFNCRLRCVARVELKWKNILWTTPQRWLHLESSLVHRRLCFSYRFLHHVKLADPFLSFAQLRIGELRENAENIYIVGD